MVGVCGDGGGYVHRHKSKNLVSAAVVSHGGVDGADPEGKSVHVNHHEGSELRSTQTDTNHTKNTNTPQQKKEEKIKKQEYQQPTSIRLEAKHHRPPYLKTLPQ